MGRGARAWVAAAVLAAGTGAAGAACTGEQPLLQAQRSALGVGSASTADPAPRPVPLPDRLPDDLRREGVMLRYTLDVSACSGAPAAAVWIYRAGAPYRITAEDGAALRLLNARALLATALPEGAALAGLHNGRVPALFALPTGARTVTLELQTLPYFATGIARAGLGPIDALLDVQARAAETAVAHVESAAVTLLVLAVLLGLLWFGRRTDKALLWLALTCTLWGGRGLLYFGHGVWGHPLLFEQYNSLNVTWAAMALGAAVLHLLRVRWRHAGKALLATALGCTAAVVIAQWAGDGARLVRLLCLGASFALVCVLLVRTWAARHGPQRGHALTLAAGMLVLVASALHDLLILAGVLPATAPSLLFWGFVVLLVAMAVTTAHYVLRTLASAERSNEDLEARVRRKNSELEASWLQLRERDQLAVRAQERERLLRDMHDGLGAQLMTALRGVERGALRPAEVAQALQDSLDELRLLMDSTDLGLYLPGALAAWRNRWEGRLAAAGITLEWHIADAVDEVQLPGDAALQVMRILQEASTNVVKHAAATRLRLAASVDGGEGLPRRLRIEIEDDGVGMPGGGSRPGGRGLKNMAHRARQLGGQLETGPARSGAGCRVVLLLPVPGGAASQDTSPRRAASMAASARDEIPSLR